MTCTACEKYSIRKVDNGKGALCHAHFCGEHFQTWVARCSTPLPGRWCDRHESVVGIKRKETRVWVQPVTDESVRVRAMLMIAVGIAQERLLDAGGAL